MPGRQPDQAVAALGVGQLGARPAGDPATHPTVHLASQPGHRPDFEHAVADDQVGIVGRRRREKRRQISRVVLAITIHRNGELKFFHPSLLQSVFERGAFAQVCGVANQPGTGRFGGKRRVVT